MDNRNNYISKMIVETWQQNNPGLVQTIQDIVKTGHSRKYFLAYIKQKFGPTWKTSLTATASLTIFNYYKNNER